MPNAPQFNYEFCLVTNFIGINNTDVPHHAIVCPHIADIIAMVLHKYRLKSRNNYG